MSESTPRNGLEKQPCVFIRLCKATGDCIAKANRDGASCKRRHVFILLLSEVGNIQFQRQI